MVLHEHSPKLGIYYANANYVRLTILYREKKYYIAIHQQIFVLSKITGSEPKMASIERDFLFQIRM